MASFFVLLSSVVTVVAFITFVSIVAWAYSKRRRDAFAHAANAPFALPDESEHIPQRQS